MKTLLGLLMDIRKQQAVYVNTGLMIYTIFYLTGSWKTKGKIVAALFAAGCVALGIIFSIIMCFVGYPIFAYLLAGAYILFNVLNLILITIKNGLHFSYLLLPFIFFILHISYGVGTIIGIVKGILGVEK